MIDNPLPDQVMQEREAIQKASDFEAYCKLHAIEIATHYKYMLLCMMTLQSGITII